MSLASHLQQNSRRSGPAYLKAGFSMLSEPGIRLFVALPLLVNIIIFGSLMALSFDRFGHYLNQLMDWLPTWLDFLRWVFWPLFVILLLAAVTYLFSSVANIIAAPFNGLLAEKVEEKLTGKEVSGRETIASALKSFPRSILREIRKLSHYLMFALLTLIASMLISPAAPFLWFALGAWMLALEYCDYAMDNHGLSFGDAKRRLSSQRGTVAGFGTLVMLGTMIPVVNLLIMPAAVCGGTLLWVERLQNAPSKG